MSVPQSTDWLELLIPKMTHYVSTGMLDCPYVITLHQSCIKLFVLVFLLCTLYHTSKHYDHIYIGSHNIHMYTGLLSRFHCDQISSSLGFTFYLCIKSTQHQSRQINLISTAARHLQCQCVIHKYNVPVYIYIYCLIMEWPRFYNTNFVLDLTSCRNFVFR